MSDHDSYSDSLRTCTATLSHRCARGLRPEFLGIPPKPIEQDFVQQDSELRRSHGGFFPGDCVALVRGGQALFVYGGACLGML